MSKMRSAVLVLVCVTLAAACGESEGNNNGGGPDLDLDPSLCSQQDLIAGIASPDYYWSFDSEVGSEATASGGLTVDNGSLLFDGVDDYLTIDGVDKTENFTMSFFAAPSTLSEGDQRMLVNLGNGPGTWEGVLVNSREGSLAFFAEGGGGASEELSVSSERPLVVNEWAHVLAIKNGSTLSLYLDGQLAAERSDFTYDINYGSNGLVLGRHSYFESKYYHGRIDEFAMWNAALSGGDVSTLSSNLESCQ